MPIARPFLIQIFYSKEIGIPLTFSFCIVNQTIFFDLADLAWEWIVSCRIYGSACGCLIAVFLSNCSLRKKPLIFALIVNLVGGLLSASMAYWPTTKGVYFACLGRFLSGMGSGIAQVCSIYNT